LPRIRHWLEEYVVRTGPELVAAIEDERSAHFAEVLEELETRTVRVAEAESRIAELERRLAAIGADGETHEAVERLLAELAHRDNQLVGAQRRLEGCSEEVAAVRAKLARREGELGEQVRRVDAERARVRELEGRLRDADAARTRHDDVQTMYGELRRASLELESRTADLDEREKAVDERSARVESDGDMTRERLEREEHRLAEKAEWVREKEAELAAYFARVQRTRRRT
jgi:chromosome segregation ATPase